MPTPERTDGASFPKMKQLRDVLPMELQNVADLIPSVLLTPIEDLLSRPKKNLRGRLVELGFEFAGGDRTIREGAEVCAKCVDILEMLHAGSLVIDDIQDGSLLRRGSPALHERYGLPIALNAGNWLYFWPLEIVRTLGLPAEREVQIYRAYHRTMMRAHVGQALDVGTPIDQLATDRVYDLCLASLQLKTGTLTANNSGLRVARSLSNSRHGFARVYHSMLREDEIARVRCHR